MELTRECVFILEAADSHVKPRKLKERIGMQRQAYRGRAMCRDH